MKRACPTCGRVDCPDHPVRNGSTYQWRKLRAMVIERDRGLCQIQGPDCLVIGSHVDHVVARTKGGPDTMENLRVACAPCNLSKGGG